MTIIIDIHVNLYILAICPLFFFLKEFILILQIGLGKWTILEV